MNIKFCPSCKGATLTEQPTGNDGDLLITEHDGGSTEVFACALNNKYFKCTVCPDVKFVVME